MATIEGRGEKGATALEYSLLLGAIVVSAVVVVVALGARVDAIFVEVDTWFESLS